MQCIRTSASNVLKSQTWSARLALVNLRCFAQRRSFSCLQIKGFDREGWVVKKRELSSAAHAFVSTAIRDTSIPPTTFSVAEAGAEKETEAHESTNDPPLTPASLSRVAAQSVRLACQAPSTHEAFLIVKSLQASVRHYGKNWYPGKPFKEKVAIDFGMAVSPRLAIHSLLHGLIRRGFTKKAGDIAQAVLMGSPQIRLSDRTLQLIMTALCQTDMHALRDEGFRSRAQDAKYNFGSYLTRPQEVTGRKVHLPCTRFAIQLFFAAKQYRKQRAKQIFQQLIDACLLQGEILVVSFLFAFLVKQWQCRSSKADMAEESRGWLTVEKPTDYSTSLLRPRGTFLSQTLAYITPVLFEDIPLDPHAIKPSHEEAVQALANLAGMLHQGLLPYGQVGALVRALVLFSPSASVMVWTLRGGKKEKWERRDAREYFDEVLDDLLVRVTGENSGSYSNKAASSGIFNSLVDYSLRRKASPVLAERVVKRMQLIGGNSAPNITTFNILIRASTAFRRHDMTGKILETLRNKPENQGHAIMYAPSEQKGEHVQMQDRSSQTGNSVTGDSLQLGPSETSSRRRQSASDTTSASSSLVPDIVLANLSPAVRRILLEVFDLDCLSCLDLPLPADGDTLAAYIDYLTVSGNPKTVAKLVKILLPELRVASYPPLHPEARRLGRQRRRFNRDIAISRAVGLGPIFFTSVLNALVKAGKTGLAERTWRLAKAAEGCSWNPEYKTRPWILPCAAYTVMMQCYAAEARKAFRRLYSPHPAVPETRRIRRVMGWGTTSVVKRLAGRQSLSLLEISRDMGAYIFRSRQISEKVYRARLISYLDQGGSVHDRRTIRPPTPDERFFNATLDLFGRLPLSYVRRRVEASPCRWRRLERRQINYFMQRGCVRFSQDARLISVLFAMREAGYGIPLAFRHILVGITVPPPLLESPRRRTVRAYYYKPGIFNATRLSTAKERGLPVRKSLRLARRKRTP